MLYRLLRIVNRVYPFVMLWTYVALFVLALPFMFIFPPLSLFLVIFAALSVPIVFLGRTIMMAPQKLLARHKLSKGVCPRCGEFVVGSDLAIDSRWHCVSCGTLYSESGEEIDRLGAADVSELERKARFAL